MKRRDKAESGRLRLLDELRGRLRAVDYGSLVDPTGERREALCAVICQHQRPIADYRTRFPRRSLPLRPPPSVIGFGVPVELRDLASDETIFCEIACPTDSAYRHTTISSPHIDPHHRRICCTSPLGNALLGHRKGETVEVHGGRTIRYEILDVGLLLPPL